MTVTAIAGLAVTLEGNLEISGTLTDASTIQLDITYGAPYQAASDYAGPYTWSGATSPAPGQVWHSGTGQYQFTWQVPAAAPSGVYVATWTFTLGGTTYTAAENVWVSGAVPVPVPAGDTGYWTGAIDLSAYSGPVIELGQVDGNGTAWLWQKITGWDSAPVQGTGVIPRAGDHGGWPAPQWYAPRTMTLTCTASAQTQALRDVARAQLQQAVPVGDTGQLAVLRYDEPVPKQALVRRSGAVTEAYPTLADVTFTVGLVAPDMRRYGTVQNTLLLTAPAPPAGGGLVVPFTIPFTLNAGNPPLEALCFNNGNFGSPPVAVFKGPFTAPAVTNVTTGQTVSWSAVTLGSSDTMTVDFLNRQAWANAPNAPGLPGQPPGGGSYAPADVSSSWWTLQPGAGGNLILLGGSPGAGASCELIFYDAWSLGGFIGDFRGHVAADVAVRLHLRREQRQRPA